MEMLELFFDTIITFLTNIKTALYSAGLVAQQGINVSNYIGYLTMGNAQLYGLVIRIFVCGGLYLVVLIAKVAWDTYLKFKESIQWW